MTTYGPYVGPCMICTRQHDNVGYAPNPNAQTMWVCSDCVPYAKKVYHMPDTEFTIYENKALDEAGGIAGEYLDSLGVTDLATLSQEQYAEFCRRLVVGFSEHIRAAVDTGDSGVPV